jgi:hypothetical protein
MKLSRVRRTKFSRLMSQLGQKRNDGLNLRCPLYPQKQT